jgi:hypothetical protein
MMANSIGQPSAVRAHTSPEAQIRHFHTSVRRRLRRLVGDSRRVGDLLFTHPGAAFVLAAGNRAPDNRGEALRLVKAGRPLSDVETALDLPRWLRRLPPEVFVMPLGTVPGGHEFGRRIVNRIPKEKHQTGAWLGRMSACAETCGEEMALWLANKTLCEDCCDNHAALLPLGAFVWFSQRPGSLAHGLMKTPWQKNMRVGAAVEAAAEWLARIVFEYCAESHNVDGTWFKERKSHGYRFLPLRSAAELQEEGERMKHCVATYAGRVAAGTCLIYSVRRGGKRVATMEIAPAPGQALTAGIVQVKGLRNASPGTDVLRAAQAWLAQRGCYPYAGANRAVHDGRWRKVWRPYCAAKPQVASHLSGRPENALMRLYSDLNMLGRWHEE